MNWMLCTRDFLKIIDFGDHVQVWTGNLLNIKQLPNPLIHKTKEISKQVWQILIKNCTTHDKKIKHCPYIWEEEFVSIYYWNYIVFQLDFIFCRNDESRRGRGSCQMFHYGTVRMEIDFWLTPNMKLWVISINE